MKVRDPRSVRRIERKRETEREREREREIGRGRKDSVLQDQKSWNNGFSQSATGNVKVHNQNIWALLNHLLHTILWSVTNLNIWKHPKDLSPLLLWFYYISNLFALRYVEISIVILKSHIPNRSKHWFKYLMSSEYFRCWKHFLEELIHVLNKLVCD